MSVVKLHNLLCLYDVDQPDLTMILLEIVEAKRGLPRKVFASKSAAFVQTKRLGILRGAGQGVHHRIILNISV